MKGLLNSEASCFLNAALQCLLYVPQLTNYCLSPCPSEDAQPKRVNACSLASEYVALVKAYWTQPADGPLDPEPVRAALAKVSRTLANRRQQHDAHEAMMAVLQGLHAAFAKTAPVGESLAEQRVDLPAWRQHNKNNYSILTEIFQGQICTAVDGEGYASQTHEHFWDVSLAVDGSTASVATALARHLETQSVDGYKHGDAYIGVSVSRTITYAPLVLIIHLKRFDNRRKKIDKFVDYSVKLAVPTRQGPAPYSLCAVCMHGGDAGSGHYAAMCEAHGQWFYVDDATSRPIDDLNTLIQRDAYVLVYRKLPDF